MLPKGPPNKKSKKNCYSSIWVPEGPAKQKIEEECFAPCYWMWHVQKAGVFTVRKCSENYPHERFPAQKSWDQGAPKGSIWVLPGSKFNNLIFIPTLQLNFERFFENWKLPFFIIFSLMYALKLITWATRRKRREGVRSTLLYFFTWNSNNIQSECDRTRKLRI